MWTWPDSTSKPEAVGEVLPEQSRAHGEATYGLWDQAEDKGIRAWGHLGQRGGTSREDETGVCGAVMLHLGPPGARSAAPWGLPWATALPRWPHA